MQPIVYKKFKIVIFLLLLSEVAFSQNKQPNTRFTFDTDFFDAVNHWVVFPEKAADSLFQYGYIYLDDEDGFVYIPENRFKMGADGKITHLKNNSNYIVKRQLNKHTGKVCLLDNETRNQIHLPEKPEWLRMYDTDWETAPSLLRKGYHYNAVGCSSSAIPFLEKAYLKNPHEENLEFELAYAYNATKAFDKAVIILTEAIGHDQGKYMLYRELGFALIQLGKPDEAEKAYETGISFCNNNAAKHEMGIDMMKTFSKLNDQKRFEKWLSIAKKYAETGTKNFKTVVSSNLETD